MSDDTRPIWGFDIPERLIRWLRENRIKSIRAGWRMTDVDKSDNWVDFVAENNETRRAPHGYPGSPSIWDYVKLNKLGGYSVIEWTERGKRAARRMKEIDDFDQRNAAERAEYERLKEKFGDG